MNKAEYIHVARRLKSSRPDAPESLLWVPVPV